MYIWEGRRGGHQRRDGWVEWKFFRHFRTNETWVRFGWLGPDGQDWDTAVKLQTRSDITRDQTKLWSQAWPEQRDQDKRWDWKRGVKQNVRPGRKIRQEDTRWETKEGDHRERETEGDPRKDLLNEVHVWEKRRDEQRSNRLGDWRKKIRQVGRLEVRKLDKEED